MEQSATSEAKTEDKPPVDDAVAPPEAAPDAKADAETAKAETAKKTPETAETAETAKDANGVASDADGDDKAEAAPDESTIAPDPNASNGNGEDRDWSSGRMSAVEAEGFAEAFRPSWGDADSWTSPAPEAPPVEAVAPAVIPSAAPKPMTADAPVRFDDEPAVLPGASSSGKKLAAVAAVFIIAIVVVVVSFSGGGETPPVEAANPPVEPAETMAAETMAPTEVAAPTETMAAPSEVVAEAPEPEPEPEPVMVRIQARTVPATARLELDGVRVGNPFDREVEQDGSEHVLRVSAEGFQDREVQLTWSEARSEVIELEAVPPPPPPVMEAVASTRPVMRASMRSTMRASMRTAMRSSMRSSMRRSMRARMSGFTAANPY